MTEESESNEWWSDDEWYRSLCHKYNIYPEIDVAATNENTKCEWRMGPEINALQQGWWYGYKNSKFKNGRPCVEFHWFEDNRGKPSPPDIWLNPPLNKGLCRKFILKAEEQWRKYNMNIMTPVPAGVISRQYFRHIWKEFLHNHGKTIFIDPIDRPKFLLNGKKKAFARNDYIILIFRKH